MRFDQIRPDLLEITGSVRGGPWFGLPLFVLSLIPFAGVFGAIEFKSDSGGPPPPWALGLFGAALALAGVGVIFYRSGVTVDLGAGTVTTWQRVLFSLSTKTKETSGAAAVVHFKKVIRSQKSKRTIYPVELEYAPGEAFRLLTARDFLEARRVAERVGKLLRLPVVDRTDGTERRREVETLDMSLRDRRRASGDQPELGQAPAGMRSRITPHGTELEIDIPGFGITPIHLIGLVLMSAPFWMGLVFLTMAKEVDGVMLAAILAMSVLPSIALGVMVLGHARRAWSVRVSAQELRVETRGLRSSVTTIPAEEIEELSVAGAAQGSRLYRVLGGGPPILAVSDRAHVSFGESLRQEEAEYLTELMAGVVSAPAP